MPKLNLSQRGNTTLFNQVSDTNELEQLLEPHYERPSLRLTPSPYVSQKNLAKRWDKLSELANQQALLDQQSLEDAELYNKNIEHFIGTVKLPVGVAGPLRVNGLHANNDYLIPLATTEAALVASYNRGAQLITAAGGASAM
ncbi:3-hydroxy-3-methylglutaryl-CoA reductase, partial [Vibrio xuii]